MSTNPFNDVSPKANFSKKDIYHNQRKESGPQLQRSTNPFGGDGVDEHNETRNFPNQQHHQRHQRHHATKHQSHAISSLSASSSFMNTGVGEVQAMDTMSGIGGTTGTNGMDPMTTTGMPSNALLESNALHTLATASADDTNNESTWQDLGDLPYRKVCLYPNVSWGSRAPPKPKLSKSSSMRNSSKDGSEDDQSSEERFGLSWYPKNYVDTVRAHQNAIGVPGDAFDLERLLSTTTTTLVTGCPNGGPVAAVTVPLTTGGGGGASTSAAATGFGSKTTIRIMNNAGTLLSTIPFPPRNLSLSFQGGEGGQDSKPSKRFPLHRSPGDILAMGFTSRCVLVVILRDSLSLCFNLMGEMVLPPFFALQEKKCEGGADESTGMDLMEARVFDGGFAVLGLDMNSSLVELLDEHDDPSYANGADVTSRRIVPLGVLDQTSTSSSTSEVSPMKSSFFLAPPPHYAIVTPLPTALYARSKRISYRCIAVLPRQFSPSHRPELFLSTSDGSVLVAELQPSTSPNDGLTDVNCRSKISSSGGAIVSMSFAPNGRFLACFTSNSILAVISTTFDSKILEFDTTTGSSSPPRAMGWCGEDSVVMHWKNLGVLMVGPYGDWLRFPFDEESGDSGGNYTGVHEGTSGTSSHGKVIYLVPEMDCCRVVTSSSVEILQRVPPGTSDLLCIGSIEPGALLLDASDAFDSGSSNADEAARSITQQEGLLEEAIQECVTAAMGEFDVKVQKRMLRAASYGLHFSCKDENSSMRCSGRPSPASVAFVNASRKVRVLNSLRKSSTGFAVTSAQYDAIMPKGVVVRLMASGYPSLASSISEYLKLGRQVRDYARAMKAAAFVASFSSPLSKWLSDKTDSQIAEEIMKIIRGEEKTQGKAGTKEKGKSMSSPTPGLYASVALAAHRAGRKSVADLLIMLEQYPADKVEALLTIGSFAEAAAVAARARDPDLIYTTISAYKIALSSNDEVSTFVPGVINKFPMESVNSFTSLYAAIGSLPDGDIKPLINILLRRQKHAEAGFNMARRALLLGIKISVSAMSDIDREKLKIDTLNEASRVFGMGGKDCAFQKSCTDEQLELLADQQNLRRSYGSMDVAPPSSSVTSTIMSILKYGALEPRSTHKLVSDADRLAKKYKVPEKRIWHVKVRALAESEQWPLLRNLADSRVKPPIGLKPFALAAIKGRQSEVEIIRYIERMQGQSDGEDRYDLYCEAGLWRKALEEAVKLGDGRRISHVGSICNSPEIQQMCDSYLGGGR